VVLVNYKREEKKEGGGGVRGKGMKFKFVIS